MMSQSFLNHHLTYSVYGILVAYVCYQTVSVDVVVVSIFEHLEELEYTRVTLTGHFDHSRELHMWPRTLYSASDKKNPNSEPGACIVTPFYCRELGEWVLVNRGWVPRRKMDPSTRPRGQVCSLMCPTRYDLPSIYLTFLLYQ